MLLTRLSGLLDRWSGPRAWLGRVPPPWRGCVQGSVGQDGRLRPAPQKGRGPGWGVCPHLGGAVCRGQWGRTGLCPQLPRRAAGVAFVSWWQCRAPLLRAVLVAPYGLRVSASPDGICPGPHRLLPGLLLPLLRLLKNVTGDPWGLSLVSGHNCAICPQRYCRVASCARASLGVCLPVRECLLRPSAVS